MQKLIEVLQMKATGKFKQYKIDQAKAKLIKEKEVLAQEAHKDYPEQLNLNAGMFQDKGQDKSQDKKGQDKGQDKNQDKNQDKSGGLNAPQAQKSSKKTQTSKEEQERLQADEQDLNLYFGASGERLKCDNQKFMNFLDLLKKELEEQFDKFIVQTAGCKVILTILEIQDDKAFVRLLSSFNLLSTSSLR